jgi:hypothetical protein
VDIYYHVTRDGLPFAIEAFKQILENAIKAGAINFSFMSRYARMRNLDFEFDMIFSAFARVHPGLVGMKPRQRIKKFTEIMIALFGERWLDLVNS